MIFKIQVKAGSGKLIKKALILIVFVLATGRLLSQDNQLEQWYQQALLLKQQQNCREAIPLLEKILQVNPAFKETVYELGWCFNEMKQYSKALEVFQLKPSITAQDFKLVYERAYSKAALGFTTDAINDYDQVSQWQPAFAPVYAAKADLYKDRIKDVSKALPLYLKAITLDTGSARNYYWAGWCYNELEQFEKAVPHLVKASENPAFRSLAFSEIRVFLLLFGELQSCAGLSDEVQQPASEPGIESFLYGHVLCEDGRKDPCVKEVQRIGTDGQRLCNQFIE
jgi:tetratricopeptide (TPR) repeat protein